MHTLRSQYGFTQWIILVVLLIGIGVGVVVAQIRTSITPQAAAPVPSNLKIASMQLSLGEGEQQQQVKIDNPLRVAITLRSDLDQIRLVSSQIKYDPQKIELLKIETPQATASTASAFYATEEAKIKKVDSPQWLENLFDNKEGKASITGLFEKGNFVTDLSNKTPFKYAELIFKPKQKGSTELILEDTSVMLRASDNANVLTKKENLKIDII